MENLPQTQAQFDKRFIFSDDIRVQILLDKKYNEYDNIRKGQNWKNSPYGNFTSKEISDEINALSNEIYEKLKSNPFYKSDRFGSNCGDIGTYALIIASFIVLSDYIAAEATTVAGYSFLSGLAWNLRTLFSNPMGLVATTNFNRISSTLIGFGASFPLLDKYTDLIKNAFNIPDKDKTPLGTQRDLHIALKHDFNLDKEIEKIQNNSDLSLVQKRQRIETRYKEAIIKIYALDYVNTYLTYGEKPEKYFWALLDLTSLLQNRDFVNFGDFKGAEIKIEPLPRLVEKTPEMQTKIKALTSIHIRGYLIQRHADSMQRKIEQQAIKNLENANIGFEIFNY